MKNILTVFVIASLMLAIAPALVLADGTDVSGGVDVEVGNARNAPVVYTDHTQRSWYPNDQTVYTADLYGTPDTNLYGDAYYDVPARGDYAFAGETMTYYIIVEDEDGENNIDKVLLLKDGVGIGQCSELDVFADGATLSQYMTTTGALVYDDETMNTYRCRAVIQSSWVGDAEFSVKATDEDGLFAESTWSDLLALNPPLSITLTGAVSFGSVKAGETVTSNTVYLNNVGTDGVVMDMYIASDDYFADPTNEDAICGDANGIPYTEFSYYATKGSVDSGDNNGAYNGLGTSCSADDDEYTELPSHSGEVEDMCRIINHAEQGSFLTQGQSMSLTFQLDVPEPCSGSFTDGEFHFVGRVI